MRQPQIPRLAKSKSTKITTRITTKIEDRHCVATTFLLQRYDQSSGFPRRRDAGGCLAVDFDQRRPFASDRFKERVRPALRPIHKASPDTFRPARRRGAAQDSCPRRSSPTQRGNRYHAKGLRRNVPTTHERTTTAQHLTSRALHGANSEIDQASSVCDGLRPGKRPRQLNSSTSHLFSAFSAISLARRSAWTKGAARELFLRRGGGDIS